MAPTVYNSTGYSSSGLSSRNNGLGRFGGSFQSNRGSLTKLSGGISRASSVGGTAVGLSNVHAPKPVNTSSLRKENGGQDISTVLVNRQGGKVGWGSSLPDKTEDQSPVRADKQHDPTPEEAVLKAGDNKHLVDSSRRETSTNTSPSHYDSQQGHSYPRVNNDNTPWALHPPNQSRDHGASHDIDRRYHQPFHKDDTPHLQDETNPHSNQYDRTSYTVDRSYQDSYGRDYGGRFSRQYPNGNEGNRDEMLYRPSSNSYRRYPDHDGNRYRDSRDNNMNYSHSEKRMYERGQDRFIDRDSAHHDGYNNRDAYDRTYNHSSYDRFQPPRSDPRTRDPQPSYSYRKDERSYNLTRDEHPSGNARFNDARGTLYSQRDSIQGPENHRPRSYVRPHSEFYRSSRNVEDEASSRVRDIIQSKHESHTNYIDSDPSSRGAERKYDEYKRTELRSFRQEPFLRTDRTSEIETTTSNTDSSAAAPKSESGAQETAVHETNSRVSEPDKSHATESIPAQGNISQSLLAKEINESMTTQECTKEMIVDGDGDRNKAVETTVTVAPRNPKSSAPEPTTHFWDHGDHSDDSSHEEKVLLNALPLDNEQKRMNQQQMVLQRVQAVRELRKKTASIHESKVDSEVAPTAREMRQNTASVEESKVDHEVARVARDIRKKTASIQESKVNNNEVPRATNGMRLKSPSIDNNSACAKTPQADVTNQNTEVLDEPESSDKVDKEKSREIYLAKRESEKSARLENRRTRGPRTLGVLFKRLSDGRIVNADLSESELLRKGKVVNQRGPYGVVSKSRYSRDDRKTATVSGTLATLPEMNNDDVAVDRIKAQEQIATDVESEFAVSKRKSVNRDKIPELNRDKGNNKDIGKDNRDGNHVQEVNIVPVSPPVSAWLAGPPPSIFNSKNGLPRGNHAINESESERRSKVDTMDAPTDALSSELLSSWSSKNDSKSKVAQGPIISTWSSLSGHDVGLFHPYHSQKQESTPTPTAADWCMDFALPRDLLSPTVDDNDVSSHHVDQAHNIDPSSPSHNRNAERKNHSKRSFPLNKKKPRFATKSQPNKSTDSDSNSKSIPRVLPRTHESRDTRRLANGTKNRNRSTKQNPLQTSV